MANACSWIRDGGSTWDVQSVGEDAYRTLLRARFADPMNGWAHADLTGDLRFDRVDGHNPGEDNWIFAPVVVWRTGDGGRTWRRIEGSVGPSNYIGGVLRSVLALDADRKYMSAIRVLSNGVGMMAGIIAATKQSNRGDFVVYRGHVLLTTRSGGASWKMTLHGDAAPEDRIERVVGPPLPIPDIQLLHESVARIAAHGVLSQFLFRTEDGGATWDKVVLPWPLGTEDTVGDYISFSTQAVGFTWGGILDGMSRTVDGGLSWASMWPLLGRSPTFADSAEGWMHSEVSVSDTGSTVDPSLRGVYHTVDGGETWDLEQTDMHAGVPRLAYESPTRAVWLYGRLGLYVRPLDLATGVHPRGRLLTEWASIRRLNQE
jgi:photosystem II stability/assembly factor-like uncharacterized protein